MNRVHSQRTVRLAFGHFRVQILKRISNRSKGVMGRNGFLPMTTGEAAAGFAGHLVGVMRPPNVVVDQLKSGLLCFLGTSLRMVRETVG